MSRRANFPTRMNIAIIWHGAHCPALRRGGRILGYNLGAPGGRPSARCRVARDSGRRAIPPPMLRKPQTIVPFLPHRWEGFADFDPDLFGFSQK